MTTVCHGRRKGELRSVPGQDQLQINAEALKNVTILSKADWSRINYQLNKKQIEAQNAKYEREEKEKRKDQSKELVKHWTNTIAGQREQKLEARRLREEAEEEERKKVDIEEAKLQAEKRKEWIEKVKTQQYYQSDRVKRFHGALQLTEVLREREAQLELARLKASVNRGRDIQHQKEIMRLYEESIRKDREETRMKVEIAKQCSDYQKAQIQQRINEKDRDREHDRKEGQELRLLAMQHEMDKRRIDEILRQEQQELGRENLQQKEDVKRMKQMNRDLDEEENNECRQFAETKRKMMIMRSDKEKELHNDRQANLDRIRNKLAAQTKLAVDDEEERIAAAIADADAKREREESEKQAKVDKLKQEILVHTREQIRKKEEEAILNRRLEVEALHAKIQADDLFKRNEEEKSRLRREAAQDLMNYHVEQMNERRGKDNLYRRTDRELAQQNLKLINMEEEQFQDYATRVIDHCSKRGRNVYPLKRAAREGMGAGLGPVFPGKGGIRPSYLTSDKTGVQLPHYAGDSTQETKATIEGDVETQKRLGFVW